MATPTLSKHRVPGALGEILVDIRAAGRGSARPAVIVLHGFKGFKDWGMFPPFSERLARAGFIAVTPNLSGSGVDDAGEFTRTDAFGHNTFSAELEDLNRVVDALYAGELGVPTPPSLGVVGHSRGGGIAILQAARDRRVRSLVTWSAISTVERWSQAEQEQWRKSGVNPVRNVRTGQVLPLYTDVLDDMGRNRDRLDIQAAAGLISIPWLLAHGTADESVPFPEAKILERAAPPGCTRFLPVESGGHTFGAVHPWKGSTPQLEQVFEASLRHLGAALSTG